MAEGEDNHLNCTNCGHELHASDVYCAHCGQKVEYSKITFKEMAEVFLYSLFNADSTLWRTLKHIWIPGKLTREYFSGKRKSYLHPVRLFLFSWVLFFAIFAFGGQIFSDGSNDIDIFKQVEKQLTTKNTVNHLLESRDYWLQTTEDSLVEHVLDDVILSTSFIIDKKLKTNQLDSLRHRMESQSDSLNFEFNQRKFNIAYEDILWMDESELFEQYEINTLIQKVFFRQIIKVIHDTSGMLHYIIKGTSWMFFIIIPIMALILYLLYFYKNHFLVEHVVFLLHIHTLFFSILLIVRLLDWVISFINSFGADLYILGIIYSIICFFIGLRSYYKGSIISTILKGVVFLFTYGFISSLSLTILLILRFLLF
ncbi:MAG: DUF3667 domain-containing protein [Saprospirales bacterium]|nr:MAG: DUF3667 domain-containing protein [Saprospirales bacterium]